MKWIVVAIAVFAACEKPRSNQCASNLTGSCVNGEVCTFDRGRGCQVCQCRPYDQTNTGNDPDDPNPPVPVHD